MTISEPEQGFKRARESDNEEITEEPATPSYLLRVGPFGRRKGQGDAKKLLESKGIQDLEDTADAKQRAVERLAELKKEGEVVLEVHEAEPKKAAENRFKLKQAKKGVMPEQDLRTDAERIKDQTTPLWRLSYADQLVKKMADMQCVAEKVGKEVQASPDILPIVACPDAAIDGYRNKCEFSFGRNRQGEPTLGFLLGLYANGITEIGSAQECVHVRPGSKRMVQWIEEYVRLHSKWEVYDRVKKTGNWRLVMIRHQQNEEMMVVVQVHPQKVKEEEMECEKQHLLKFLNRMNHEKVLKWISFGWQVTASASNVFDNSAPIQFVTEATSITEQLTNLESNSTFHFRISAFSFFQSNTLACERLYQVITQWAVGSDPSKRILLLDLCSGTGTIGISMSAQPQIQKIMGIELCADAVRDAKANAEANGLDEDRVEYICAKIEAALPQLLERVQQMNGEGEGALEVVAVLDPPRAGVHKSVIAAIRDCPLIQRLVYVSCKPQAALKNFVDLCRPKNANRKSEAFELKRVQAVDMFPHTVHCELVLEFQRQAIQLDTKSI